MPFSLDGNLCIMHIRLHSTDVTYCSNVWHDQSASLSVTQMTDVSCKNGWTNQDAVCHVGPIDHVLDGVRIPQGKGACSSTPAVGIFNNTMRHFIEFLHSCLKYIKKFDTTSNTTIQLHQSINPSTDRSIDP